MTLPDEMSCNMLFKRALILVSSAALLSSCQSLMPHSLQQSASDLSFDINTFESEATKAHGFDFIIERSARLPNRKLPLGGEVSVSYVIVRLINKSQPEPVDFTFTHFLLQTLGLGSLLPPGGSVLDGVPGCGIEKVPRGQSKRCALYFEADVNHRYIPVSLAYHWPNVHQQEISILADDFGDENNQSFEALSKSYLAKSSQTAKEEQASLGYSFEVLEMRTLAPSMGKGRYLATLRYTNANIADHHPKLNMAVSLTLKDGARLPMSQESSDGIISELGVEPLPSCASNYANRIMGKGAAVDCYAIFRARDGAPALEQLQFQDVISKQTKVFSAE